MPSTTAPKTLPRGARRLRVGVTIGLHRSDEVLWNNGIKQNAVFLASALANLDIVDSVHIVNTTDVPVTDALRWDRARWPTCAFDDIRDDLDVLVELGGQVSPERTDHLKRRGTRLVSYCCGFEYVHAMQAVLFGRRLWGHDLFVNQRYDDIWMVPQVANISQHYFQTLRRQSARIVPFVWSPVFLAQRSAGFAHGGEYRPREGARRLGVIEPNIDVVKFCLYPTFIAEEAYRLRPERIALLQVTNAEHIARENPEFISLMHQLDIVREHKAVFLGRHETPAFLAEMADVIVSHQWENALNYLYLEVCWQGYPLIHNADLCADLGYHYPGQDVQAGAQALLRALDHHDTDAQAYQARQRALIARYLPENPDLLRTYEQLLLGVLSRPAR
jgi:hypothetical protein